MHLNLAYRWFCRLGLEDPVPDHSSFSKNRHGRFRESDVFRHVFEGVVQRCMNEGLVRGEGFAVDASIIKANANRTRGISVDKGINWQDPSLGTRAVRKYLQAEEYIPNEDWTSSTRILCRQCSEGPPHEQHDRELQREWTDRHLFGIATLDPAESMRLQAAGPMANAGSSDCK